MLEKVLARLLLTWREALDALEFSLELPKMQSLIDIISKLKGKIIFTGLGKSGLIAKKLAASFASIGCPSLFLHSHEALHGDLGVVTPDDLLILLSNSGEGREIRYLIDYSKKRKITTVGVSREGDSCLIASCDLPFVLPKVAEASSLDIPTTSTSMMLFWGDYLMLLLVEDKNLTRVEYSQYHPAGRLGLLWQKLEDLVIPYDQIPWVAATTSFIDLLKTFAKTLSSCIFVKGGGVIYKEDLLNASPQVSINQLIREPLMVEKTSNISEVLDLLQKEKNLLVVDNTQIIGLLNYEIFT